MGDELNGLNELNELDIVRKEKISIFLEKNFLDFSYVDFKDYLQVTLHVTPKCNLKCSYCSSYDNEKDFDETLLEKFLSFFDELPQKRVDVFYHGGEPLLHPYVWDFTKELLKNPKINKIVFYTNLSIKINNLPDLVNTKKLEIQPTFHSSVISKKKGSFETFYTNLRFLKEHGIIIDKIVYMPKNYNYREFFESNFPEIRLEFSTIDNSTEYLDTLEHDMNYIVKTEKNHILKLKYNESKHLNFKNTVCFAKMSNVFLDWNGNVYVCTMHFLSGKKPLGNVFEGYCVQQDPYICQFYHCCNALELPKMNFQNFKEVVKNDKTEIKKIVDIPYSNI